MKYTGKFLTIIFAVFMFIGFAALDTSAQSRSGRRIYRPIIVRNYYIRHDPFWYYNSWGNPYYRYYDPYYSLRRQKSHLESELRGNQSELRKHLEKYNADGVITAKEREELDDDYRDVARAQRELNEFNRRYR